MQRRAASYRSGIGRCFCPRHLEPLGTVRIQFWCCNYFRISRSLQLPPGAPLRPKSQLSLGYAKKHIKKWVLTFSEVLPQAPSQGEEIVIYRPLQASVHSDTEIAEALQDAPYARAPRHAIVVPLVNHENFTVRPVDFMAQET
ncbi:hypothetical protein NDU88_001418 [Pleurodeles waltl]|uniref:Uncharacterized protein n=1 Tax=Pleurodeles waltl TaxID=8319 RepID=A0AAV7M859_PLEWA|nr:hypothetical protein NDU88_001418 [Pleurodeles waltl]